jgi:hypothetical protein
VLELVGHELRVARLHAIAGAMGEAERHVLVALQLVETAPQTSLPRIVRRPYRRSRVRYQTGQFAPFSFRARRGIALPGRTDRRGYETTWKNC